MLFGVIFSLSPSVFSLSRDKTLLWTISHSLRVFLYAGVLFVCYYFLSSLDDSGWHTFTHTTVSNNEKCDFLEFHAVYVFALSLSRSLSLSPFHNRHSTAIFTSVYLFVWIVWCFSSVDVLITNDALMMQFNRNFLLPKAKISHHHHFRRFFDAWNCSFTVCAFISDAGEIENAECK